MRIPRAPKWDRAVDGLDISDFARRAQEFERSLLPHGIPREGEIWRAIRNCPVFFMACFAKEASVRPQEMIPDFRPFGSAEIPRGEEVRILPLDDPRPFTIDFLPVRYAEMEEKIVPANIRLWPGYSNYQLSAPTARTVWPGTGSNFFVDCFVRVGSPSGGP
jgi:hypothetical protein